MAEERRIIIDHREEAPTLQGELRDRYGFAIEIVQLGLGDYRLPPDILIERKTTRDFALSIVDGRLFRQAYRLAEEHHNSFLIVEGASFHTDIDVDMACIRGAFISLAQTFRLPVLRTRDQEDTAWTLGRLFAQRQRLGMGRGTLKSSRSRRLAMRKEILLRSFPGVGPKLAAALLRHFGSIGAVVQASEEELLAVPGMGRAKVMSMREILAESPGKWSLSGPAQFEEPILEW